MQYLLMIYDDESNWNNMSESQQSSMIERYIALENDLKEQGIFLGSARLADIDSATSVQVREGKPLITDGPFAETKEQLGGYFLVDCENLDQATEIAARIPSAEQGTVEVRPLWYQDETH